MPIEKIDIDYFLSLSNNFPILDVRSPAEYNHAHIPGAFSMPIFTDEQRAIIRYGLCAPKQAGGS